MPGSFRMLRCLAVVGLLGGTMANDARGQVELSVNKGPLAEPLARSLKDQVWLPQNLPFSFQYDGKPSAGFLDSWVGHHKLNLQAAEPPDGRPMRFEFTDPKTGLQVVQDIRVFGARDAMDYVVTFKNTGTKDTAVLSNILPLDVRVETPGHLTVRHSRGSNTVPGDFEMLTEGLMPNHTLQFESDGARSSSGFLPYFNLDSGHEGLVGAIGWTGGWSVKFAAEATTSWVNIQGGMKRTHLILHPGEEIRTPRIVLMHWKGGDWIDAQNRWRRLMLEHYAPRKYGGDLYAPISYATWGTDSAANKLAQIAMVKREQLPFDVFWIDAGWFGHSGGGIGQDPNDPKTWYRNRGNWWVNDDTYPDGLKPIAEAAHAAGMKFLLWTEPEQADPGTSILTAHGDTIIDNHPGWFYSPSLGENPGTQLLDLGKPEAREGMGELLDSDIVSYDLDWYRQDFNVDPSRTWAAADAPDRVGMAEIRHVEGEYALLDGLRARHPALDIDNCSAGGRRLDLEMAKRTVALWRSDLCAPPDNDIHSQTQTQGLVPWVPLSGASEWMDPGPFGAEVDPVEPWDSQLIYKFRSSYSAALDLSPGSASNKTHEWCAGLKAMMEEYREVRPFTYGDFYPLTPWSLGRAEFCAFQWDRRDRHAGVLVVYRRPDCAADTPDLHLRAIDPAATYAVEIRTGIEKAVPQMMRGSELAALKIKMTARPGSAVVFYNRE
jgi:alpha-galactosidase